MNIARFASDPTAFRDHLVIPSARGPARLGQVLADFQRADFAALDPALIALARGDQPEPQRFWWERTKGASKDTDAAVALLWLLAFSPRPLAGQVGAADQDQAGEVRKACRDILRLNGWLASIEVQQWSILNKRTGSSCAIIAADVAGSHGARPDLLILNELSHITRQDFALNLLDNAGKVPHGLALICTNAGFVPSWQYDLRELARTSERWHFSSFSATAPWLDAREVQEARRRNSANRFARLWRGEWVAESGDALQAQDIDGSLRLDGPAAGREEGYDYFTGVDLSVSRDASAVVTVAKHWSGRLRLVDARAWLPAGGSKIDLVAVGQYVWDVHLRYRPKFLLDPYQAELLAQQLTRRGCWLEQVAFAGRNLVEMASTLIEVFSSRGIDLYRDEDLLADLRQLRIRETGLGFRLDPARTARGHGDKAVALSLAVLGARRRALPGGLGIAPEPCLLPPRVDLLGFGEPTYGGAPVGAQGHGEEYFRDSPFLDAPLWPFGPWT
jgi:hypothetical protein